MLKSMTGFGKAECELDTGKVDIEIKSLNSKQLDLNIRLPKAYKEKEIELRNTIAGKLERGKVELSIYLELTEEEKKFTINQSAVKNYYTQLKNVAGDLNLGTPEQLLQIIMQLPDTIKTEENEPGKNEWNKIADSVNKAVNELIAFRTSEGAILEKDISNRIQLITNYLLEIEKFETQRIENIKSKINKNLDELIKNNPDRIAIDENRFEQELIYYLEKLDITEEKVRLNNHCSYFLENIKEQNAVGKKLGFIAQEIGREINTIGSKANDVSIQHLVVKMKDELEKIKEQLMNIL